jgi:His/Glu/Gln/Arg/opine family amino acid ABC transporter permease subunit
MESSHQLMDSFYSVLRGVPITLEYTLLSSAGGMILGLALALMKLSHWKVAQLFARFYTSVFRGTPMLVQLSIIYFGAPSLISYKISPLMAGVIAFSLNSGAYVSAIVRAGIQGLDRGQFEAARALGIPYFLMMKDII